MGPSILCGLEHLFKKAFTPIQIIEVHSIAKHRSKSPNSITSTFIYADLIETIKMRLGQIPFTDKNPFKKSIFFDLCSEAKINIDAPFTTLNQEQRLTLQYLNHFLDTATEIDLSLLNLENCEIKRTKPPNLDHNDPALDAAIKQIKFQESQITSRIALADGRHYHIIPKNSSPAPLFHFDEVQGKALQDRLYAVLGAADTSGTEYICESFFSIVPKQKPRFDPNNGNIQLEQMSESIIRLSDMALNKMLESEQISTATMPINHALNFSPNCLHRSPLVADPSRTLIYLSPIVCQLKSIS